QKAGNRPWAGLRVRWTSPEEGPAAELRLRQAPLIATPGLVAQPVELAEIKAGVDLPVSGPFRVRARGQSGVLDSATDVNHRSGYQFGPVYRWRPAAEVGVFYSELGYEHATAAGYFAPRRAQTVELGTYIEYEGLSPAQVEGMSGQPDFQPSGPPISVQKGLPLPRQCRAAASMASRASVASCPCPPQKCLLFSRITTQPFAESHDRSFRPTAKALQSAVRFSGKRSARDTSARKSSLS